MKRTISIATGAALAFALSACELRRDEAAENEETPASGSPEEPEELTGSDPTPETSPAASIIRDDANVSAEELTEPLAEPVEMTLSFPDGSDISADVERQLVGLMQQAALAEDWPVILSGHTDSGGNDQANLRASRARAEAVAAWLVERGVADERIEVIAFGEQNPLAPNALPDGTPNEAGRRANRRVEIRVAPPAEDAESNEADQDA